MRKQRRNMESVTKVCGNCCRNLGSKHFLYSQKGDQHLEDYCRTCRAYKGTPGPTLIEVEAYEEEMKRMLRSAVDVLEAKYKDGDSRLDISLRHRAELGQMIMTAFLREEMDHKWSYPIWIHPSFSTEFMT